jgi:hypothetical protein
MHGSRRNRCKDALFVRKPKEGLGIKVELAQTRGIART